MDEQLLRFLDSRRHISRHEEINRGNSLREPSVTAQKANALETLALAFFEGAQNIFRFTAGGQRYESVALFAQAPDLPRKNFVGVIVIANRCHVFAVGR